jgi:hypothetical protein
MKFYGVQPSEFWRLDPDELAVLGNWMREYQRQEREANK